MIKMRKIWSFDKKTVSSDAQEYPVNLTKNILK